MNDNQHQNSVADAETLHEEFLSLTASAWQLPDDMRRTLTPIFVQLGCEGLRPPQDRRKELQAAINSKLKLNQLSYKAILNFAAENGVLFN